MLGNCPALAWSRTFCVPGNLQVLDSPRKKIKSELELLVEVVLFMGYQEKHFMSPHMGDCGVARFIWVEIRGCSSVPSPSITPWKKSNHVLSEAKTKVSVQSFSFIVQALAVLVPVQVAKHYSKFFCCTQAPTGACVWSLHGSWPHGC